MATIIFSKILVLLLFRPTFIQNSKFLVYAYRVLWPP